MRYTVVKSNSIDSLAAGVNILIKSSWAPVGGLVEVQETEQGVRYCQAMINHTLPATDWQPPETPC